MANEQGKDKKASSRQRIVELIEKAIDGIEKRLEKPESLTLADCLKVMQLQKELEEEQPEEVTVTWVEPGSKKET